VRGNDSVKISRPLATTSFVLESTTDLNATNWQPFLGTRATNNGRVEISVPLDAAQRFFRLRQP